MDSKGQKKLLLKLKIKALPNKMARNAPVKRPRGIKERKLSMSGYCLCKGGGGGGNPEKRMVCKSKKVQINCLQTREGKNEKFAD